jgi:hypothetical protein
LAKGVIKMNVSKILNNLLIFTALLIGILTTESIAELIYVDSINGSDINPGTKEKPTKTISKAATVINNGKDAGPTKIVISPGLYYLEEPIVIDNNRPYGEKNRLTITASILPDESEWMPALMPTIISIEFPKSTLNTSTLTETYSIKVKINHVTIQGLKFLGNPTLNNMHGCVERIGKGLDDLLIKQCVFIGDRNGACIYAATLATGDRFVVEHCIFKGCVASAVYWDGLDEIGGRNCAMRYCIIDEAYMSGPWTCQTTEDFEFHHNVVTNSEYFWIRKQGDRQIYKINKCVIIGNKHFSGYGTAAGPTGQTGDEVTFEENNIIKEGIVHFETNQKSRNYMHIKEGSIGKDLGAGLFTQVKK